MCMCVCAFVYRHISPYMVHPFMHLCKCVLHHMPMKLVSCRWIVGQGRFSQKPFAVLPVRCHCLLGLSYCVIAYPAKWDRECVSFWGSRFATSLLIATSSKTLESLERFVSSSGVGSWNYFILVCCILAHHKNRCQCQWNGSSIGVRAPKSSCHDREAFKQETELWDRKGVLLSALLSNVDFGKSTLLCDSFADCISRQDIILIFSTVVTYLRIDT